MRLSGTCSNHSDIALVRNAADERFKLTIDELRKSTHTDIRPAQGKIQDAILRALKTDSRGLSPARICDLVSNRLGTKVSHHTVSSFLSVAARCQLSAVERVAPGVFSIAR